MSLRRFIEYFTNQWLKEPNSELVNHFLNVGPRTTDFAEGFNRKLRDMFHSAHPDLAYFMQVMKNELESHTMQAERIILNGQRPKLRKKKYRQAERRYMHVKMELEEYLRDNNDVVDIEYLSSCARSQQRNACRSLGNREIAMEVDELEVLNEDNNESESDSDLEAFGNADQNLDLSELDQEGQELINQSQVI